MVSQSGYKSKGMLVLVFVIQLEDQVSALYKFLNICFHVPLILRLKQTIMSF